MSSSSTTTTTTATMRSSQRVLLEAFPAPPSHIPQGLSNPPPTGPPSMPLPPIPGPSRISVDEQLLFLSSVAQRSRRSSRYSNRESIISVGSGGHGSSPGTSSRRTSAVMSGSPITKVSNLPPIMTSKANKHESVTSTRSSPRSPSFFPRPSISISAAPSSNIRLTPTEQLTRLAISPMLLSDIEDDETDVIPARIPSPFLDSSWRRSKHHHNESISSIDVRDILGVDADGTDEPVPPIFSRRLSSRLSPSISHEASFGGTITPFSQLDSLPIPTTPTVAANSHSFTTLPMHTDKPTDNGASSSDTSSSTISATSSSTSISDFDVNSEAALSSTTVKDLRLERRAERTKSAGLKKELAVRSRAGNRAPVSDTSEMPSVSGLGLESDTASIKTAVPAAETVYEPRKEDMTLEELGPLPTQSNQPDFLPKVKKTSRSRGSTVSHASVAFPVHKDLSPSQTEMPRTPSPDIDTILSSTPRPALKKSPRTRVRSQGNLRNRASHPSTRRRASEGVLADGRTTMSWHGHGQDGSELPYLEKNRTWGQSRPGVSREGGYDEELEKTLLDSQGSPDEFSDRTRRTHRKKDHGEESDSSIDLHTPLPHLMVRDGLLSPHSRLLPSMTRSVKRSDSIMTTASFVTKSGIMKDERDTPMRRVRHRDNRLLRGGIGLTTGLGWSDSEDEDAPSPLTRRLSTINLSRRSSASSIRTMASIISRRHPLSRSYSSGALIESEQELLDELSEEIPALPARPRLPSGGRLSRASLPPTSWQNKSTNSNRNSGGTRTSTSSIGSSFSFDATMSDSVRLRPSKISSGLRDSYGSSGENYERVLAMKRQSGEDRTSSSTTSSASFAMPVTPKDYDPAMSSPANLGMKPYDKEKTLPPLPVPHGVLKKKRSNLRIDSTPTTYGFPRSRTFSASSAASNSSSPTSAAIEYKPTGVRPLQLPRQAARSGADRPAVPVPSVVSTSASQSSLRSPPSRSPTVPQPTTPTSAVRPRPRTGTGMTYRTSSVGSRIKLPMTLTASTSGLGGKVGMADGMVGSINRAGGSRIPPL